MLSPGTSLLCITPATDFVPLCPPRVVCPAWAGCLDAGHRAENRMAGPGRPAVSIRDDKGSTAPSPQSTCPVFPSVMIKPCRALSNSRGPWGVRVKR